MSDIETESLAHAAGLSLDYEGGYIVSHINYTGKLKELCSRALISEKMLRNYKTIAPAKQAVLAVSVSLGMNAEETDGLLHKYGYCLSGSIVQDIVVKWYLDNKSGSKNMLDEINNVLDDMGLPLLMTRQKE